MFTQNRINSRAGLRDRSDDAHRDARDDRRFPRRDGPAGSVLAEVNRSERDLVADVLAK
ncbi:hypothetical protein [Halorussus halobius]|uniref:hypothetical protein n=1 Tax=Halorussus halobius TaxID=1710537 RepID=UPI00143CD96F|nr:hypothetical protein [Halorussus halobius]